MKDLRKILLVSRSGIGDMIMFTPTINTIRQAWPDAELYLLTNNISGHVLEGSPMITGIIHYSNVLKEGPRTMLRTIIALRRFRFDAVFVSIDSYNIETAAICLLSRIPVRVGHVSKNRWLHFGLVYNKKVTIDRKAHDTNLNLRLLDGFSVPRQPRLLFHLNSTNRHFATRFLRNIHGRKVAVHISRNCDTVKPPWPKERFVELCRRIIRELEMNVILIAGPDESNETQYVYSFLQHTSKAHLLQNESLKNVAAVIRRSDYIINNDSGMGHIASAFSVPSLTIFGPTNHVWVRPFSHKSSIVRLELECSPCYAKMGKKVRCKDFHCLDIPVNTVFDAFRKLIAANPPKIRDATFGRRR